MKNSNNPFWYDLITKLISDGVIFNGSTIPYLIGVKAKLDNSFIISDKSIKLLLEDIADSSTENIAILQNCSDIRQYVIGLRSRQFAETNFKTETYFSNSNGEKSLFITKDASSLGTSIEEISNNMNGLYLSKLKEERFSWNSPNWESFSSVEQKRIEEYFNVALD